MPQYEVTVEIEVSAVHTLKMMGNGKQDALTNARDSVRATMMADPMRLLKTRKVELETVHIELVKEDA